MDDLSSGIAHFNAGRFEEARRCFLQAEGPEAKVFLGHVEAALGRRDAAAAAFCAAINGYPRHVEGYVGLANLLLNEAPARRPDAERVLRRVLTLKSKEALLAAARAFRAAGDLDAAEKALTRVAGPAAKRRLADVVHRRGEAYLAAGELDKAEKELRRVLALNPSDAASKRGLKAVRARRASLAAVLRRKGMTLVSQGKLGLAESTLRRAAGDKEAGRLLLEVLGMRAREAADAATKARLEKQEKIRVLVEELNASGARKAEGLLAEILKLDPKNARACLYAGGLLLSAGATARGRAWLEKGLRLGGPDFAALLRLGRHKAALACAERALDRKPTLSELRAFWDPWDWAERPLDERRRAVAALPSELWRRYYLSGHEALPLREAPGFTLRRYGWMLAKSGHTALCAGSFDAAEADLRVALRCSPRDWRTRGSLAEVLLCRGLETEAFAELARAATEAPADEAGQAIAWRGEFLLWLGRYEEALVELEKAMQLGSDYAATWRGAALLKLGRPAEALEQLNTALARHPRDLEAYVWRGEAKRALGRNQEALADLTGAWLWARVNRALAKHALGDRAGFDAEFAALPAAILEGFRRKSGLEDGPALLEAGLALARGFRREEYAQALWMR